MGVYFNLFQEEMQNLSFKLLGLRRPFVFTTSLPTLFENKPFVLSCLMNSDAAIEEIVKILQSAVEINNQPTKFNKIEIGIFNSIVEKLKSILETVDETQNLQKHELDAEQTTIL